MKMDLSEVFTAQVRGLQAIYPKAHIALLNWASWSRDRRGIFPVEIAPPSLWDQADPSKFGDFADESDMEKVTIVAQKETKAERIEAEPYDEKAGYELDCRIHGSDFAPYLRGVLRAAYVTRTIPESQMPNLCGCSPDAFLERLEACLVVVGRFA